MTQILISLNKLLRFIRLRYYKKLNEFLKVHNLQIDPRYLLLF